MAERVKVRQITNDEGNKLLRIVRQSSGSVVTWRRAQMVLLSAQGMDVAQISEVAFTSPDRVREVLHNFNDDGFDSLYPKYSGGRPPTFTLPRGIPTLAPSMRLRTVFDYSAERPKEWEQTYTATVIYADRAGTPHTDRFVLDLSMYFDMTWIDRKGLHDIHGQLEKLTKEIHNMRTGWDRTMPNITEDRATYVERSRAEQAEMIERHRQAEQRAAQQADPSPDLPREDSE